MGRGGGNGDNRDLETGVGLPCLTGRGGPGLVGNNWWVGGGGGGVKRSV